MTLLNMTAALLFCAFVPRTGNYWKARTEPLPTATGKRKRWNKLQPLLECPNSPGATQQQPPHPFLIQVNPVKAQSPTAQCWWLHTRPLSFLGEWIKTLFSTFSSLFEFFPACITDHPNGKVVGPSLSGNIPGLQAWSEVGAGMRGNRWIFPLSPSPLLPSPSHLSKNKSFFFEKAGKQDGD